MGIRSVCPSVLKKTEAMCQLISATSDRLRQPVSRPAMKASWNPLTSSATWEASCPTSSQQTATSHPVSPRQTFGKLQRRLWGVHDVSMKTKIAVYQIKLWCWRHCCMAVRLDALIPAINPLLDQFHLRCLWKIARIPKQVFLGQLAMGKRLQCGPVLRYKDALKVNIWSSATSTRQLWAVTHRIAEPGELCAIQQSPTSKIRESGG